MEGGKTPDHYKITLQVLPVTHQTRVTRIMLLLYTSDRKVQFLDKKF